MNKVNLIKAANELNELFGLIPKIDTNSNSEILIKKLREAKEFVTESDVLTQGTINVLFWISVGTPKLLLSEPNKMNVTQNKN